MSDAVNGPLSKKQPLKILTVSNRVPWPLNDGGNLATFHLINELHQAGEQIQLLSLNTRKHFVKESDFAFDFPLSTVPINTDPNPLDALKALYQNQPYISERFKNAEFERKLVDILKNDAPEIVQFEGSFIAQYAPVVRKHSHAKLVLRSHNVESRIWQRLAREQKNPFKKWYFNDLAQKIAAFEQKQLQQLDGVVAITANDLDFYQQTAPDLPAIEISAGMLVHDSPQQEEHSNNVQQLCFLGSLEWQPNLSGLEWFLEKVWPALKAQYPQLEFHIAGKNPPDHSRNWEGNGVRVHGMVPDADAFLLNHGPLIVPLFSGSGMRIKIVQAMALKKTIISTSVGSEGIPLESGSSFLLAENKEQFMEAVGHLLTNDGLAEKLANNARVLAEELYDWSSLVKKYQVFYQQLCSR